MECAQVPTEEGGSRAHVIVVQLKHTNRITATVDRFTDRNKNELRICASAVIKALAVHGCLNVVPERFDVAGKARHITHLFHVDDERALRQIFIWPDAAEFLCLCI